MVDDLGFVADHSDVGFTPDAAPAPPPTLGNRLMDLSEGAQDAAAHFTYGAYETARKGAGLLGIHLPELPQAFKQAATSPAEESSARKWGRRVEEIAPFFATGGSALGSAGVAGAETEGNPAAMAGAAALPLAAKGLVKAGAAVADSGLGAAMKNAPSIPQAAKDLPVVGPYARWADRVLSVTRKIGSMLDTAHAENAAPVAAPSRFVIPEGYSAAERPGWRQGIVDELNSAPSSSPAPESAAAPTPGASNGIPPGAPAAAPVEAVPAPSPTPSPTPATSAPKPGGYEQAARARRAQVLARFLYMNGEGVSHADASAMTPNQWDLAWEGAKALGGQGIDFTKRPSASTIKSALGELKNWEDSAAAMKQP